MSPNGTYTHSRPVGVTILVVLLWVEAIIAIVGGIFLIAEHNDLNFLAHADRSSDTILAYGIAALIIGLITALVASALSKASNFARWLVGLISLFHLAGAAFSFFALDGVTRGTALVQALVALVVLYILFGEEGSEEFFTG